MSRPLSLVAGFPGSVYLLASERLIGMHRGGIGLCSLHSRHQLVKGTGFELDDKFLGRGRKWWLDRLLHRLFVLLRSWLLPSRLDPFVILSSGLLGTPTDCTAALRGICSCLGTELGSRLGEASRQGALSLVSPEEIFHLIGLGRHR